MPEPIRLSPGGPEFPTELLDSLLAGEVVFLCGAGVSAPQLPDFGKLVRQTYKRLRIDLEGSEKKAFDEGRYEEVLGALDRRLADPFAVEATVSDLLAVPESPELEQHKTVLRLSRGLDNQVAVVTTNFDTLFERAVRTTSDAETESFAGQALPAPGSVGFSGIIHLHGRLRDDEVEREATPLVLTSADYGDAYLRSGWASRFLFDLVRCRVIVLVGYRANDAPVRYILNVLSADRSRFPDLHRVYAFDAYSCDGEEVRQRWDTLAVRPIAYSKVNPETGETDHSPLWISLAHLAEIVDRPRAWRRRRAREILAAPPATLDRNGLAQLRWLLRPPTDLWPLVIDEVTDAEWFKTFSENELWSNEDATWVVPAWVALDFSNPERLKVAREWQSRLGRPFTERLERRLRSSGDMDDCWMRIWRLFCLADPLPKDDSTGYVIRERLESNVVLHRDLEEAVSYLGPRLQLEERWVGRTVDEQEHEPARRLGDILRPRMAIRDAHCANELVVAVTGLEDRALDTLELASESLRSALALQRDLELIAEDVDVNDFEVSSIEDHVQNEHQEGVSLLVRVLVDAIPGAVALDSGRTNRIVESWWRLPGRIGVRLCLHAMRNADVFRADVAMRALLGLTEADFWTICREIALLLRDRAGEASSSIVSEVEARVCGRGETYYARFSVDAGQPDWRPHSRDKTVWLRLTMLEQAEVLSENGLAELQAIRRRREHLDREVEDRDFFGAYMYGQRVSMGEPEPILERAPEDRLEVARELVHSPDPELGRSWWAFCRTDPQGAYDVLCHEGITRENGALWSQFLSGLAFGYEATESSRTSLGIDALARFRGTSNELLEPLASGLADVLSFVSSTEVADFETWLQRVWEVFAESPGDGVELTGDLLDAAINSAPGRLVETLVRELSRKRHARTAPTAVELQLLAHVVNQDGAAGQLGRGILARYVAFLMVLPPDSWRDAFRAHLMRCDEEGSALRAVMLEYGQVTPAVSVVLKEAVIRGGMESRDSERQGAVVASKILIPAVAQVQGRPSDWGLTGADVRSILRNGPAAIRSGALRAIMYSLEVNSPEAKDLWGELMGPLLNEVWPPEKEFLDHSTTQCFVDLVAQTGEDFPEALGQLWHYILAFDQDRGSLYAVESSGLARQFPRETLELVWRVCGRRSGRQPSELARILDHIVGAEAQLETDRRLQWLELQAERVD